MPIIDAHHHYWWHAKRTHVWPEAAGTAMSRDFTPADLEPELAQAGIDGTVLVQTVNESGETEEFLDLAAVTPSIFGVVGWIPLNDPAETARQLARLSNRKKLVGFRNLMRTEATPNWLLQHTVLESLSQVADAGLVFESVPVDAAQFEQVIGLAERLPNLRIVVDHLGRPPVSPRGWQPWASLIERAASLPNVAIKLSIGFDLSLRWRWSVDELKNYIEHVVRCFGAHRCMAGSNWPVVLFSGSYQDVWRGIGTMLAGQTPQDRQLILGETARSIYRLP
ncbi:MAG TPA: amidohydrolase family protein [Pseudolabrys sp.]|jgi:L-fuconolactonase